MEEASPRESDTPVAGKRVSSLAEIVTDDSNSNSRRPPTRKVEPPDTICCPITLALFRDPVVIATGFSYEREAINKYWQNGSGRGPTCPKTNLRVDPCRVITNWAVRAAVERWLDENPEYQPEGWDSRELLPTPRRRSSARDDFMEVISRMREQVNEMEQLARDCAREAVAARDALGALHLFRRRLFPQLAYASFRGMLLVFVSMVIAVLLFPTGKISTYVMTTLILVFLQVAFSVWYALRWNGWLRRALVPLVREITASRDPPDPEERFQLAVRALFSTELLDNIT